MINNGLFSSNSSRWETPPDFFQKLDDEFYFDCDVCATKETAKCSHYFDEKENGLKKVWEGTCFMNPPYGREIEKWVRKAYEEGQKSNCRVVALLPSRTDTVWFHKYVMKAKEIRFIIGRLKFVTVMMLRRGKKSNSAPFPSLVAIFDNHDLNSPRIIAMMR